MSVQWSMAGLDRHPGGRENQANSLKRQDEASCIGLPLEDLNHKQGRVFSGAVGLGRLGADRVTSGAEIRPAPLVTGGSGPGGVR